VLTNENQLIGSNLHELSALSNQHVIRMKIRTQQPIIGLNGFSAFSSLGIACAPNLS